LNKLFTVIFLFSIGIFSSCGKDDNQNITGSPGISNSDFAVLYFEMENENNHIISLNIYNFQNVSTVMFTVIFDSLVFQINSVTEDVDFNSTGGGGPYYEKNNVGFYYEFSSPISGDGTLATIDFDSIGNLAGTDIVFGEIIFLDQNNNFLYYNCSNHAYTTPEVCRDNGGYWGHNAEELSIMELCYIDEGIIIQATSNSDRPMAEWTPTGNYVWSSGLCAYE